MPGRFNTFRPCVEQLETRDVPSSFDPAIPTPAPVRGWMQRHLYYNQLAARGRSKVLFLGDSITQRWLQAGRASWMRYFAPLGSYAFGINGDATQSLLWRITHGELRGQAPKAVVVMIGTNNVNSASPPDIARGVAAITRAIRAYLPRTKVLLLGILPRGGPDEANLRVDIAATNQLLARLSNGNTVRFLDVGRRFLGSDAVPRRDLMPDYLHLSAAGYRVLGQAIHPTVRALVAPPRRTATPVVSRPAAPAPRPVPTPAPALPSTSPYQISLAPPTNPVPRPTTGFGISPWSTPPLGGSFFG